MSISGVCPKRTDFQKKVWAAQLTIPFGQTKTYSEIPAPIGHPTPSLMLAVIPAPINPGRLTEVEIVASKAV